jgi:hypothetical protein
MDSKEELRALVDRVAAATGKTQEELATEMGYGGTYISESLTPTGKVSSKFLTAFRKHYSEVLEIPKNGKQLSVPQISIQEYIVEVKSKADEIKRHNLVLENIIQANLTALLNSQNVILSQIKAGQRYEAQKDAKGDHKKQESILHEINKYSGEYYVAMTKEGIHADGGR